MKRFFAQNAWVVWVLSGCICATPFVYSFLLLANGINPDLQALAWVCFVPADFTNALSEFAAVPMLKSFGLLLSHQFFHFDVGHLFGNVIPIVIFGLAVEKKLGSLNFLLAFLASGIVGGIVHWAFMPDSPVPLLGASGALGGILGVYSALFFTRMIEWRLANYTMMAFIIVMFLLPNLLALSGLTDASESYVAVNLHIGSYIFGLFIGLWRKLSVWEVLPGV